MIVTAADQIKRNSIYELAINYCKERLYEHQFCTCCETNKTDLPRKAYKQMNATVQLSAKLYNSLFTSSASYY